MDEKSNSNGRVKAAPAKKEEPAWYDFIVKIFQDLLEINMHTYRKEKTPRL